ADPARQLPAHDLAYIAAPVAQNRESGSDPALEALVVRPLPGEPDRREREQRDRRRRRLTVAEEPTPVERRRVEAGQDSHRERPQKERSRQHEVEQRFREERRGE